MKPKGHEKEIPCNQYHMIDGKIPEVKGDIHSIQNKDFMSRTCDCRKAVYSEGMCTCPGEDKHWQIIWQPNPNY